MNDSWQVVEREQVLTCWTLTEGAAGMRSQVRGLATAMGFPQAVEKTCGLRLPWRWLPNHPLFAQLAAASGDVLAPPWPDLLVSCGRKAALLSMAVKERSGPAVRTIHIQDPKVAADCFDIVVVPDHDRLRGANVLVSRGALHHVTAELLASAGAGPIGTRLAALPRPRLAVLIGGPNRYFAMPQDWLRQLARDLAESAANLGGSLLVSISRRSPPGSGTVLGEHLSSLPLDLWDGQGDNPYLAYLALADAIVVTGDSTSMTSEACATGVSVHVAQPPPRVPGRAMPERFARFHDGLLAEGLVHAWHGPLTTLPEARQDGGFNDTAAIATEIRRRLRLD